MLSHAEYLISPRFASSILACFVLRIFVQAGADMGAFIANRNHAFFLAVDLDELRIPASAFGATANRVIRVGAYSTKALTAYTDDQFLNFFHLNRDSQGRPRLPVIVDRRLEAPFDSAVVRIEQFTADAAVVCDPFRCRFCNASSPKTVSCSKLAMAFSGLELHVKPVQSLENLVIRTSENGENGQIFTFNTRDTTKSELTSTAHLGDGHGVFTGFGYDGYSFFVTHFNGAHLSVVKPNAGNITQLRWLLNCDTRGLYTFTRNLQLDNKYIFGRFDQEKSQIILCEFDMTAIAKEVIAIDWDKCAGNDTIKKDYLCQPLPGCRCSFSGTVIARSIGPFYFGQLLLHTQHYVYLYIAEGSIVQIEKRKRNAVTTVLRTQLLAPGQASVSSDGYALDTEDDDIILVFMSCGNLFPTCKLPGEDSSKAKCAWCEFANGTGASFRASDEKYCKNKGDSIFSVQCPPTIEAISFLNDTNVYRVQFDSLENATIDAIAICSSPCALKMVEAKSVTCEPQSSIAGGKCIATVTGSNKDDFNQKFSSTFPLITSNYNVVPKNSDFPPWIIIASISAMLAGIIAVLLLILDRRKREHRRTRISRIAMENMATTVEVRKTNSSIHVEIDIRNKWEIDLTNLSIDFDKELGRGAFAFVCKGSLNTSKTTASPGKTVAVKLPIETKSLEELQHELEIMARIGHHPNIIQLHGFIDDGEKIAIVIEVAIMSLLQYVKKFASDQTSSIDPSYSLLHLEIPPYRAYSILRQIASAMSLLASKNLIHRDLAARNILLTDRLAAKISDFGLCCRNNEESSYYMATSKQRLPVRWMSIEALYYEKFSEASDVWSMGVLMYEMFSDGAMPYQGIANAEIRRHIGSGNRLEKPEKASDEIYDIMSACWEADPHHRPTFDDLYNKFMAKLETMNESEDYYLEATDEE